MGCWFQAIQMTILDDNSRRSSRRVSQLELCSLSLSLSLSLWKSVPNLRLTSGTFDDKRLPKFCSSIKGGFAKKRHEQKRTIASWSDSFNFEISAHKQTGLAKDKHSVGEHQDRRTHIRPASFVCRTTVSIKIQTYNLLAIKMCADCLPFAVLLRQSAKLPHTASRLLNGASGERLICAISLCCWSVLLVGAHTAGVVDDWIFIKRCAVFVCRSQA